MKQLIQRAHPVLAVLVDALLVYELGKELISDIKQYRKNRKSHPASTIIF